MTLTYGVVVAVIGGSATVATVTFWAAFYLGRIWSRLMMHDERLDRHDERLDKIDEVFGGPVVRPRGGRV